MAAIDQIVQLQISQTSSPVTAANFGVPLILGTTNTGWTDAVHSYSSPAGMLTDGFTLTSPEYIEALALFNGSLAPSQFFVGKRGTTDVAQADTLAVNTLVTAHAYSLKLNGTLLTYTSTGPDTQQSILGQLLTQATATGLVTGSVAGTGAAALLTLTGTVAGQVLTYSSIDTDLTHVQTVTPAGIVNDLAAVSTENNGWYGLLTPSASDNQILQAAPYVEANQKRYFPSTSTGAVVTSSTTDVGSKLQAAGYNRTALIWTAANINTGLDATWVGQRLPTVPGSSNWAFVNCPGQVPDALTQNQASIAIGNPVAQTKGKNVNIYQTVGGQNIMQMGTSASGQYIDIGIGLDWLQATIQQNLFLLLTGSLKIPYTDVGASVLVQAVIAAIRQGIVNGLIDGSTKFTVSATPVAQVPAAQRANRVGPPITFSCRLAGAVNAVSVQGTVTI